MQLAAVGLAVIVAVLPRRRDVVTLAALGAAVLIAVQLGVTHWFYLYIVWFLPLVLVALLGRGLEDRTPRRLHPRRSRHEKLLDRVSPSRRRRGDRAPR